MSPAVPMWTPGGHTKSHRNMRVVSAGSAAVVVVDSTGVAATKPMARAKKATMIDEVRMAEERIPSL